MQIQTTTRQHYNAQPPPQHVNPFALSDILCIVLVCAYDDDEVVIYRRVHSNKHSNDL